ncbi:hypothetical protein [Nocardioides campestrisoli]|uniref:hypothetical protein n=1 Tax=Nocardioides campestrisoli TaxID=2736757 RepID=UPI0015E6FF2C|nr:hypothetical protein [Nocardioides campestrisoli]
MTSRYYRTQLEQAIQSAKEEKALGVEKEWLKLSDLLDLVRDALTNASPQAKEEIGGQTGEAIDAAFRKAAEDMGKRAEILSGAAPTLGVVAQAMSAARTVSDALQGRQGREAPKPPMTTPGTATEEDVAAQRDYDTAMAQYQAAEAADEEKARQTLEALEDAFRQSVGTMKEIHGEPDPVYPGGGNQGPGAPSTPPPAVPGGGTRTADSEAVAQLDPTRNPPWNPGPPTEQTPWPPEQGPGPGPGPTPGPPSGPPTGNPVPPGPNPGPGAEVPEPGVGGSTQSGSPVPSHPTPTPGSAPAPAAGAAPGAGGGPMAGPVLAGGRAGVPAAPGTSAGRGAGAGNVRPIGSGARSASGATLGRAGAAPGASARAGAPTRAGAAAAPARGGAVGSSARGAAAGAGGRAGAAGSAARAGGAAGSGARAAGAAGSGARAAGAAGSGARAAGAAGSGARAAGAAGSSTRGTGSAARAAGAAGATGGRRSGKEQEKSSSAMEFEQDWLDDEGTGPGVLS